LVETLLFILYFQSKTISIYMRNLLYLMLALAFLAACDKKETPAPTPTPIALEVQTVRNLPADPTSNSSGQPQPATGKFTLYSLKDNAIVPNADSASNRWDIGFRATTIIINGGAIRSGQGGAYIHTGLFEELISIPQGQVFGVDNSITELAIPTGSGNGWYNYNPQQNWISPLAGRVLVIRTGDGKYAKVEILSYYENAPAEPSPTAKARYYTFRYVYQPDGSQQFENTQAP
jgi:hypothetical protein